MRASIVSRLASRVRGALLSVRIRLAGGTCGGALSVGPRVTFKYPLTSSVHFGARLEIGPDVVFHLDAGSVLSIGDHTRITGYAHISAAQHVEIGSSCLIAEYVSIRDSDHGIAPAVEIAAQPMSSAKTSIGNGCWIGRGVAILKGSTLGDGTVVGANAVVKGSFDSNVVLLGVPARVACVRM